MCGEVCVEAGKVVFVTGAGTVIVLLLVGAFAWAMER